MVTPRKELHLDKASFWQSRSPIYFSYRFLSPNLNSLFLGLFKDWDFLYWLPAISCINHRLNGLVERQQQQIGAH